MSNLHPFLAAVQAAHDAYGLPDNVIGVSISDSRHGDNARFTVSMGTGRLYAHCSFGHGPTLAAAFADCDAREAVVQQQRADDDARAELRRMAQAAGISPDLVAA